jgi:hypothetical protein
MINKNYLYPGQGADFAFAFALLMLPLPLYITSQTPFQTEGEPFGGFSQLSI